MQILNFLFLFFVLKLLIFALKSGASKNRPHKRNDRLREWPYNRAGTVLFIRLSGHQRQEKKGSYQLIR